jgi:hypothetical protein
MILAGVFFATSSFSQEFGWVIDKAYNDLTWEAFVEKAEQNFEVNFYFDKTQCEEISLSRIETPLPLVQYLQQNLTRFNLNLAFDKKGNIFLTKEESIQTELSSDIYPIVVQGQSAKQNSEGGESDFLETNKEHLAQVIVIGNKKDGLKSKKAIISGHLYDEKEQLPIFGATLLVEGLGIGTATDENGYYKLKLDKGSYTLLLNDLNHTEQKVRIQLHASGGKDFFLESKAITLEGVVVTSDRYDKVQNTKMGFERLSTKSIKEIPLVLGERDILKVATLLPGIQSVGEGAAGFNVRGSPADQNLFYIDNVPVYNTSHLFGFFSVFNSDAISEFSLSKSNIPAKWGGRLASIFDIKAKEGDKEQVKVRGGISPITGRVLVEGPLQKGKSSFMVGARSTYSNWILKLIKNPDFKQTTVFFADAMAKVSFNLNQKNKIQAFGYYSFDKINFAARTKFDTRNEGASFSWKRFFNEKSNMDFSLVYSKYGLDLENYEVAFEAYRQNNLLNHKEAKLDFTLRPNTKHIISFGTNAILYEIDRGAFAPAGEESQIRARTLGQEKGLEAGFFISEEWAPSSRFSVIAGLRYNLYNYLGPQSVFEYKEGQVKELGSIVDTLQFENNEPIKVYTGLDYRLATKFNINSNWSIKASYNKLHQYIFLLSNTIALSPSDKWKLTDYNIEPMVGQQISAGVYTKLWNKKFEFSVEGYYKIVDKLVEYRDGADLLINEVPEWDILQGDLDVYGIELMLKKPGGRLNGWVNYTYSTANVLVNGAAEGEQINFGQSYPANHDKPHSLNAVANYKFIRRFSLSANLVYSTGKPITYPTTVYYQNEIQLVNFTSRNKYRVPDYLRMDLSVKVEGNLKAKKFMHGVWVFSIYNIAGRNNVYNAYFKSNGGKLTGYKVSVFANPIFSVTYNFKFGNYDY